LNQTSAHVDAARVTPAFSTLNATQAYHDKPLPLEINSPAASGRAQPAWSPALFGGRCPQRPCSPPHSL